MRERAELLGGTLEVGASPTGGTLITARIPLTEHDRSTARDGPADHNPRGAP
jgi:signal transduction histidine kinase